MERRNEAKKILVHYVTFLMERCHGRTDSDTRVEIETIVDLIFDEIDEKSEHVPF